MQLPLDVVDRQELHNRTAAARHHDLLAALDGTQHLGKPSAESGDGELGFWHVQNVHCALGGHNRYSNTYARDDEADRRPPDPGPATRADGDVETTMAETTRPSSGTATVLFTD